MSDPEGWFYYCGVEIRSRVKPRKRARMRQVDLIPAQPLVWDYMVRQLKERLSPSALRVCAP